MSRFLFQSQEAIDDLMKRLAECPSVARYGSDEPGALVLAFKDIEESMRELLDVQLPKLADPAVRGDDLADLLWDITTDQVRHILYHLRDPEYFRILDPIHPKDDETQR